MTWKPLRRLLGLEPTPAPAAEPLAIIEFIDRGNAHNPIIARAWIYDSLELAEMAFYGIVENEPKFTVNEYYLINQVAFPKRYELALIAITRKYGRQVVQSRYTRQYWTPAEENGTEIIRNEEGGAK